MRECTSSTSRASNRWRRSRPPRPPGARVSGEATPHHLTLTDDVVRTLDSRFKMNPPLRSESDRRALIEALKSGVIDCVATDHAPHARHEKEVPFEQAPMGTTGLETAFAALYTELVLSGELELDIVDRADDRAAARCTACRPRGSLPASRPTSASSTSAAQFEAGANGYVSRSANCCFHGRTLHGRVLLTVAAGAIAFSEQMLAEAGVLSAR